MCIEGTVSQIFDIDTSVSNFINAAPSNDMILISILKQRRNTLNAGM